MSFAHTTVALLVYTLSSVQTAGAQELSSYICVPDQLVGYKQDPGTTRWASTTFTSDEKIVVKQIKQQPSAYEASLLGTKLPALQCKTNTPQSITCDGLGTAYHINFKSMRYMSVYANGYWNDDEENFLLKPGQNTPSMGIGRCSPL